jgi:hypothetical protein
LLSVKLIVEGYHVITILKARVESQRKDEEVVFLGDAFKEV